MMSFKERLDENKIPVHIAITMDGNGRWAKKKGRARVFGHRNGVKAVREVTEACAELGVKHLTLYAFSTENWSRPQREVSALMNLLVQAIKREVKTLMKNEIKLSTIGDTSILPAACRENLLEAVEKTKHNNRMELIIALSYSSRWEIINAVKSIATKTKKGEVDIEDITEEYFSNHLETAGMPDPELMIRTSGEQRISNFLMWQLSYAELYFTEVLWPDFRKENLYEAIYDYQNRERRFGKTTEQLIRQ